MGTNRLRHDAAYVCATALLDMACGALMAQEHKDFHDEAYHIVLAALEAYDIQREREAVRLCKPSRN
jgi:hypothetical protein